MLAALANRREGSYLRSELVNAAEYVKTGFAVSFVVLALDDPRKKSMGVEQVTEKGMALARVLFPASVRSTLYPLQNHWQSRECCVPFSSLLRSLIVFKYDGENLHLLPHLYDIPRPL